MRKNNIILIILMAIISIGIFAGSATWIYTDLKANNTYDVNNNYNEEQMVALSLDGGGMFYKSIEDALDHAEIRSENGGEQTIIVLPNRETTIKRNCAIAEKVKVFIAYGVNPNDKDVRSFNHYLYNEANSTKKKINGKDATYSATGPIDCTQTQVNYFRKTLVKIAPNVTLTIRGAGELNVGARYGEIGPNGEYSEILLGKNSKIINSGLMNVYGYIKEDKSDNLDGELDERGIINDNGTLRTKMSLYDISREGSTLNNLLDNNICPLNTFDFSCLQTNVKILCNSNFVGNVYVKRTIGGQNMESHQDISIISSTKNETNYLFKFPETSSEFKNSYFLKIRYCSPNNLSNTFDENIYSKYQFYFSQSNELNIGQIKIQLKQGDSVQKTINTANYYLPFSYRMKFEIMNNVIFNCNKDIKLLPGSKFVVGKGARIRMYNNFIMYENSDLRKMDSCSYRKYTSLPDPIFINNGTVRLLKGGRFAGLIQTTNKATTEKDRACLDFTGINSNSLRIDDCKEGKYGKVITHEAVGITEFSNNPSANPNLLKCHFNYGQHYSILFNSSNTQYESFWNKRDIKLCREVKIVLEKRDYIASIYHYNIYKKNIKVETPHYQEFSFSEAKSFYVDGDEHFKITTGRGSYARYGADSNPDNKYLVVSEVLPSETYEPLIIRMYPREGRYLTVDFYDNNLSSLSGLGFVVTTLEETFDGGSHWSAVCTFGVTASNLIIAYSGPGSDYPNYRFRLSYRSTSSLISWSFLKTTIRWGSPPINKADSLKDNQFYDNSPYSVSDNTYIMRIGKA